MCDELTFRSSASSSMGVMREVLPLRAPIPAEDEHDRTRQLVIFVTCANDVAAIAAVVGSLLITCNMANDEDSARK